MDEKQSAMLWQLMQSMSPQTQDNHTSHPEGSQLEHTLLSLRPLLQPRQQKILDLIIKMQEIKALINEINL